MVTLQASPTQTWSKEYIRSNRVPDKNFINVSRLLLKKTIPVKPSKLIAFTLKPPLSKFRLLSTYSFLMHKRQT